MDIAKRIKALRHRLGMNQTEFGKRIGVDQSTVGRYERGEQKPKAEATAMLAELAGQTVGEFLGLRPILNREVIVRTFPVVGERQAGVWRESVEWDPEDQYEVPAPVMGPGMPGFPLRGYVVRGTSMNRIYPDGTLVFVASTIANGISPKNGNRVLVSRRNRDGLYEATLKEYVVDESGNKWLWPRSFDPEFQAPVPYKNTTTEEVTITGIVMASFILEALR